MRKCGFHVQATSNTLRQAIAAVKPTVIVSLAHDYDFWRGVKRDHPGVFLVGRRYEEDRDWRAVDPRRWAEQCAALEMPYDAYVTWNEPTDVYNWITPELALRHDEWCCHFRYRIMELGYQAVALNVPTGHFHRNAVVNLFPSICREFDYIGLHEYSTRVMWDQDPKKQRPPEEVPKNEGELIGRWYCQRYRDWHDGIVARWPEREGKFQMVVTECGVAYGVMPGWGDVGWRTDLSEDQYLESLYWYFGEMNQDDYCLGGAIFMMGFADPKWASFETLPLWKRLLEIPEAGDAPAPPPTGNGGEMDIKIYDREGNLQDWDWVIEHYGPIQIKPITDLYQPQEGEIVYRVAYLREKTGESNCIVNVRDVHGNPVEGETVMWGWPNAPAHGYAGKPSNWTETGDPGDTNVNGDVGPGMGTGAYYWPPDGEIGPHWLWVWDHPSEFVNGIGMIAGTPHDHLDVGYRAVAWGEEPEPQPEPPEPGDGHAERIREIADELYDIADELEPGGIDRITVSFKSGLEQVFKPVASTTQALGALLARVLGK
jgi:hypothetical protein